MYKFFLSKQGFTLTELMIVITILSILTTISLPIFGAILKKQKINECKNNRETIETTVREAMTGMMDSGAPQKNENNELYINFERADPNHISVIEYNGTSIKCFKLETNPEGITVNTPAFTLGDLRCGYYSTEQAVSDIKSTLESLKEKEENYNYNYKPNVFETYVMSLNLYGDNISDTTITNSLSYRKYKLGCLKGTGDAENYINDGYFLKKQELNTKPFYTYLDNQEIPVCPFSTEDNPQFYYILDDGSVICSCSECKE